MVELKFMNMGKRARSRRSKRSNVGVSGSPALPGLPPSSEAITAVAADGWQATIDGTPPSEYDPNNAPVQTSVLSAGFTATGAATSVPRYLTLTKRVRLPFPNQATLTDDIVALSDFIYASDTAPDLTNNSTQESPKPAARWGLADKSIVGDSLSLEVLAHHRDAKEGKGVACVIVSASDGTTEVTATVSTPVVSPYEGDQNAVICYPATLDISTLDEGLVTVNAKVFPHYGVEASVLDSADTPGMGAFTPRFYRKDVALAAAPLIAVIEPNHEDASATAGAVSTDPAVARATPWTTLHGLLRYGVHDAGLSAEIDVYVREDLDYIAAVLDNASSRRQQIAALNVMRDPELATPFVVNWSGRTRLTHENGTRSQMIKFKGLTVLRTGLSVGESGKPLEIVLEDCVVDFDSGVTPFGADAGGMIYGGTAENVATGPTGPLGSGSWSAFRGLTADCNGSSVSSNCMVGCALTDPGRALPAESFIAFNSLMDLRTDTAGSFFTSTYNAYMIQNEIELTSAMDALRISGDSDTSNTWNVVWHNNTVAGNNVNRGNSFYDETLGTPRTHTLMSLKGNIFGCLMATKGDIFISNGAYTGNWPYAFGVGQAGNIRATFSTQIFVPDFPGVGTLQATAPYDGDLNEPTEYVNPLFVDTNQRTPMGDGTGGGDYRVQAGSPAIGISPSLLAFDLDGGIRPANATSGCFEYGA